MERKYPHARDAFTEGLVYEDGRLYESTGLEGASAVRRLDLATGVAEHSVSLEGDVFGEGLAAFGSSLVQLTYQNGRAFVWNRATLSLEGEFAYEGEGWGLCYDGQRFVMSNGTNVLQLRDPLTFQQIGALTVDLTPFVVQSLNELECVGGEIFANVLEQRQIVRIDGTTGEVKGLIDTGTLLLSDGVGDTDGAGVLNGIAYVPERERFLLTGKNWPWVFEVAFVPWNESDSSAR